MYLIFVLFQLVNGYLECLDNYSMTTGAYALSDCIIDSLEGTYQFCGSTCFNKSSCVGFNYIDLKNVTRCELLCNVSDYESWFNSIYFEKSGIACYTKIFHFMLYFVGGICLIFIPIAGIFFKLML